MEEAKDGGGEGWRRRKMEEAKDGGGNGRTRQRRWLGEQLATPHRPPPTSHTTSLPKKSEDAH
jgi:hypothetical protein